MEWPQLGWVDVAMLGVVAISALYGAMRGLSFEVLSLAGWFAAWFAALWLGPALAPQLPIASPGSAVNGIAAFVIVFLVVLIVSGLTARAVSALVGRTVLRPVDRLLGAAFGVVRGVVLLLAVATLVAYTPLVGSAAWRESLGAVWLNAVVREILPLLAPGRDAPAGARSAWVPCRTGASPAVA